jgi:PTS system nitrogen regulatory IIA component
LVIQAAGLTEESPVMGNETMGLEELATYLQRDVREVSKMASRGHLPGRKVAGEWRFVRVEINLWIETHLHAYTEKQLTALESGSRIPLPQGPLVSVLLSESCVAVPLLATTRSAVLRELVNLAERSWQVFDRAAILKAIRDREDMESTTLPGGVAIPHPHRPLPMALGESLIAFGRTASPIPFGAALGGLTDIFLLVCCRDATTHLCVMARLARLFRQPGFTEQLREAETPAETWELIAATERDILRVRARIT